MLGKFDLFNVGLKTKPVSLEQGDVLVRELTSQQTVEFARRQSKDPAEAVYHLIRVGVVNQSGECLFDENDLTAIRALPASMTNKLVSAIMQVSGMTGSGDTEEKKGN